MEGEGRQGHKRARAINHNQRNCLVVVYGYNQPGTSVLGAARTIGVWTLRWGTGLAFNRVNFFDTVQ